MTWVIELFQSAVREVPAYRGFLLARGVRADSVQTLEDFRALPVTTKENYQRMYSLPELCRGGRLPAADQLAVSSGSTGEPCIWPRRVSDELGTIRRFVDVLVGTFGADEKATLCVVCFALGNWVGGIYTTAACRELAASGYPITVATPGNNIAEILRVLQAVGGHFEQVVLLGYPPFLRDVLDAGALAGIDWARRRTKLVAAGEVFDEAWRARVCEQLGAEDPALAVASLYGTADGGVLANETSTSVRIRRALAERPELLRELFGQARLPTLCQFDPTHRFIERVDEHIVFSADGIVPLLRYDILDQGGVILAGEMQAFLRKSGLSTVELDDAAEPFVYVFGRSGSAISYYGANVYPENIGPALGVPELARQLTGKFVLEVAEDGASSRLRVTVELARAGGPNTGLTENVRASIEQELVRQNSEYANYVPAERRGPEVILKPFGDPADFPPGSKHRFTRH